MADSQRLTVNTLVLHHACSVGDCDHKQARTGAEYCSMHERRLKRTGSLVGRNKGRRKHQLYNTYNLMKRRCYSEACNRYADYGGRGVKICDRWLGDDGFENFVHDMGDRPTAKHSVDRIDNDGDYEPANCRWATIFEQAQNTRVKSNVSFVGVSHGRWGYRAYITKDGKQNHLGWFNDLKNAIEARKKAEVHYGRC